MQAAVKNTTYWMHSERLESLTWSSPPIDDNLHRMSPGIAVNGQDLLQAKSIQMVTIAVVKRISHICGNLQSLQSPKGGLIASPPAKATTK